MNEPSSSNAAESRPVVTPDLLAPLICYKKVSQPLRVRGRVTDVRIWEKGSIRRCYGKLKHGVTSLSFCLSSDPFPVEDEDVVLAGVLSVNNDFAVELRGELQGAWQATQRKAPVAVPHRDQAALPLSQFVAQFPLTSLGFLATKVGWEDICTASGLPEIRHCRHDHANFADESEFIESLRQLAQSDIAGIVLARGGGEKLGGIGHSGAVAKALIETGLPFYVALGHSNDALLLDKHADECFVAPSDLAHRLRACILADQEALADRDDAERREMELGQAQTKLVALNQQLVAKDLVQKDGERQAMALSQKMEDEAKRHSLELHRLKLGLAAVVLVVVLLLARGLFGQ